jgi:hypothetical protein
MAVGSGLRTMKIQDKACALTATGGRGGRTPPALTSGLGILIEVDRPDVFRFPGTKLGGVSPDR